MSFLLLDPYKGENPSAFNNPPVNEVLVTALDSETGLPATLTRRFSICRPRSDTEDDSYDGLDPHGSAVMLRRLG